MEYILTIEYIFIKQYCIYTQVRSFKSFENSFKSFEIILKVSKIVLEVLKIVSEFQK